MAKYRAIQVDFWEDGFVLDLTPEEKYFYLYLLSNSRTTQCGCYELPYKVLEMQTGYNRETVEKLLQRFVDYKKIEYSAETKEILIKNWYKFNFSKSPKVMNCILKEIESIKNIDFKKYMVSVCIEYGYSIDSLSIDLGEKEKQKEKQKEKEYIKTKTKTSDVVSNSVDNSKNENLSFMSKIYQENIGIANGVVAEWLIDVSEKIDIDLFKRAVEICTEKGNNTFGYLKGITNNWLQKNITSYEELKAFELQNRIAGNSFIKNSNNIQNSYKKGAGANVNNAFAGYTPDELEKILLESQKGKFD
ncbi:DnaD domain protein [Terrisporobacter sp.]|uniref:DnaD domain protein n=3 Tax=Terrisporobacter TaxID=1505652 RepID=UPI002896FA6F|nr:DnaD domain protein [Terrisporobacter sp.]